MKSLSMSTKAHYLNVIGARSFEAASAVALVLIFFAFFWWLLGLVFPSGASMNEIMNRERMATGNLAGKTMSELLITQDGDRSGGGAVAVLGSVYNTVKSKRVDEIAWSTAPGGMALYDRDAVQTFQRSSATLDFGEQNVLNVGANSLVIIKKQSRDIQSPEKKDLVLMVDGELRGKISGPGAEGMQMVIATPRAVARMSGSGAEFKVTVNPDQSSTIAVYQGVADVATEGKAVQIGPNKAVTVGPDRSISAPQSLPSRPMLLAPSDAGSFFYRDLSPKIFFAWNAPPGATTYHIVLARDSAFQDVFLDEKLHHAEFTHGKLKQGTYYWRVSAVEGDREGPFSLPWQFVLTQKKAPPTLVVQFPPKKVAWKNCELTGHTDPGARVFIRGREVHTFGQGQFRHTIALERGINIIVVEAVDDVGNVSYRSCTVHGKF